MGRLVWHFSPFWCFDAKGGEGSIRLFRDLHGKVTSLLFPSFLGACELVYFVCEPFPFHVCGKTCNLVDVLFIYLCLCLIGHVGGASILLFAISCCAPPHVYIACFYFLYYLVQCNMCVVSK